MAYSAAIAERGGQPLLSDMVRRAIELLQYNRGGYLLVVDGSLMRRAAEQNEAEQTLAETREFDRAIGTAMRYAGASALIVVASDRSVGGLSVNGYPRRNESGIALLGLNSTGRPWMTWATGPKGPAASDRPGEPPGTPEPERLPLAQNVEPAAMHATVAAPLVGDAVALAGGTGSERLHGILDNTVIFSLLADQL